MAGRAIVTIGAKEWLVDLATTPWELAQGLGRIPGMPPGTGMLFDLGYERAIEVTTEPMLFPLDIAFLSGDLAVTEVYHDVAPGLLLASASPARYFLEVNSGEMEGVQVGEAAEAAWIPLEAPQVPSWTAAVYGFAGLLVAAVMLSTVVRGIAPANLAKAERPQLLAHTKPNRKPTRGEVSVRSWEERDRLGIWITDSRNDKTVAEWWDDDARQLFEDGFFKPGMTRNQEISGHAFENSVLDYAEYLGILAVDRSNSTHMRGGRYGRAVKGTPTLPEKRAAMGPGAAKPVTSRPDDGEKSRLEYLPDSPELLAWTIEDIGYRNRIDSAFTQAIARARKER